MSAVDTARSKTRRLRGAAEYLLPERDAARWLLLAVSLGLVCALWFGRIHYQGLMGDDLILLVDSRQPGGFAHTFLHSFVDVGAGKWRPLVTSGQSLLLRVFDGDYQTWVHLLTFLEWANVLGATALAWVLSGRRWSVAVVFALALVTSRFNNYFVWQTFGYMEGLALSFTLGCIAAGRNAWRSGQTRWLGATVLAAMGASLCHERYLCLVAFVALIPLLSPAALVFRTRLLWVGAAVLVPASNYFVKVVLLNVDFFTGAAGEQVKPTTGSMAGFLGDGASSLVGWMVGPSYLVGADGHTVGAPAFVLAVTFVMAGAGATCLVFGADLRRGRRRVAVWLLGPALLLALLLMACISTRQEHRWLYTPQIVLLLGLAWAAGREGPASLRPAGLARRSAAVSFAVVIALASSAAVDLFYSPYLDRVYYMDGQRTVDSVLDRVVHQHAPQLSQSTVFIVTTDQTIKNWYLYDGAFFRVYAPGSDVRIVPSLADVAGAQGTRPNRLAFVAGGGGVTEVAAPLPTQAAPEVTAPRRHGGGQARKSRTG